MSAPSHLPVSEIQQPCGLCLEREDYLHAVSDMIMRQRPMEEILAAICRGASSERAERQIAILLFRGGEWSIAAQGDLEPKSAAVLCRVDAASLSSVLLVQESGTGRQGLACEYGWARHLYSGVGELLGLLLCLEDGPFEPSGAHAARIESACRLSALALEQEHLLSELSWQATHDALTGLLNRVRYDRELHAVVGAAVAGDWSAALLHADLDRFRLINEVLGQAIGDRVLVEVAARLRSSLRPADVLARTGGDEFAILLPQIDDPAEALARAESLQHALSAPLSIGEHQIFISATFGVARTGAQSTPASLEHQAFIALYQAKQSGGRRVMLFHPSMACTPPERLEMEKRLRLALPGGELQLWYQPQITFADRRISGAEVLLRWRPEGLAMISPGTFVPILEQTGLITEIGRWVLGEACRQAAEWCRRFRALRVAVNVSAVQIQDPGFVTDVERVLAETGLPPHLLELELTESLFVGDFAAASKAFEGLRRTGVSLALDDFGTGQASLSYLRKLRFHRLKLDQSFVRSIAAGEPCPPLVESIFRMARTLGMTTISEGIETAHQAAVVEEARSDEGQGFYFAPPLPLPQFESFWARYDRQSQFVPEAFAR